MCIRDSGNLLEGTVVEGGDRVLNRIDRAAAHGLVNVAHIHADRRCAQVLKASDRQVVGRYTQLQAGQVGRGANLLDGEDVARAVNPVGGQNTQAAGACQLVAQVSIPVAVQHSPQFIPALKCIRRIEDTEIRHAVICEERAVRNRNHAFAHQHLVDQVVFLT